MEIIELIVLVVALIVICALAVVLCIFGATLMLIGKALRRYILVMVGSSANDDDFLALLEAADHLSGSSGTDLPAPKSQRALDLWKSISRIMTSPPKGGKWIRARAHNRAVKDERINSYSHNDIQGQKDTEGMCFDGTSCRGPGEMPSARGWNPDVSRKTDGTLSEVHSGEMRIKACGPTEVSALDSPGGDSNSSIGMVLVPETLVGHNAGGNANDWVTGTSLKAHGGGWNGVNSAKMGAALKSGQWIGASPLVTAN